MEALAERPDVTLEISFLDELSAFFDYQGWLIWHISQKNRPRDFEALVFYEFSLFADNLMHT